LVNQSSGHALALVDTLELAEMVGHQLIIAPLAYNRVSCDIRIPSELCLEFKEVVENQKGLSL